MEPRNAERPAAPVPLFSPIVDNIQMAVVGGLLILAFWPILLSMGGSWFDENTYMEHGILVIPAAAYMVWTDKNRLKKITPQRSVWGVVILFLGALQAVLGIAAHWVWVSRMAFLVSLVGFVLAFYGWRMIRALTYPLCTLVLMIAPPTFVYERLTLSLQLLASRLGETFLEVLGYSVVREGNVLELVGAKLSVVEACSGIRSMLSILFMCTLYNYFFVLSKVMRVLILVMSVPIAILGNAGRILATGMVSQYNTALIHGEAHDAFGYVSIVVAAVGCVLLHILMMYTQRIWRRSH